MLATCSLPAGAEAARVVVLGPGGRAHVAQDRFLPAEIPTPAPATTAPPTRTPVRTLKAARKRPQPPSASSTLLALRQHGTITPGQYRAYHGTLMAAEQTAAHLTGTRKAELDAVLANLHAIAVAKQLSPSRLPALFLTLANNRRWWTTGPLLSYGERVEFNGSQLVWEYYPGQGIELQALGSFGKADGLYTAGRSYYGQMRQLLAELIPLAATRAGGLTWEYYFQFDGGLPPWTSAMSQATALEALTRGYKAFGDTAYLGLAHRALPVFNAHPPTGVSLRTSRGLRFVQYTFTPGTSIINAFLQALIGLYDYAHVSKDPKAISLFAAGDAEARAEVPSFDTGAWSLYQPGIEDSLDYHELVTGFLEQMCQRTRALVYCTTASRFTADLTTAPVLRQLTLTARRKRAFSLRFQLSKYSHVGVVVLRGTRTVFSTSASFAYGSRAFAIPALSNAGSYTVHLAATDLAGNYARIIGTLSVTR
jgi:D-glucuronyl C5-epimerase C-terminus